MRTVYRIAASTTDDLSAELTTIDQVLRIAGSTVSASSGTGTPRRTRPLSQGEESDL
jgi:hypothetical protein